MVTARCWCGRGVSYDGVECAEHDDPPPATVAAARAVMLQASDPAQGCTRCGDQHTVQLHPHLGRADAAWRYLAAYLRRETDVRFVRARLVLALASETAQPVVLR